MLQLKETQLYVIHLMCDHVWGWGTMLDYASIDRKQYKMSCKNCMLKAQQ